MRKFLIPLILCAILAVGIAPALATPTAQLNDLARYFPADTPVFIASRIDDAYFQTLDGLLAKITAVAPPGTIPPITINQALDSALADGLPGKTFSADIRPWLGDTLAMGVLEIPMNSSLAGNQLLRPMSNPNNVPFIAAIAIKDRAAATTFLTDAMTSNEVNYKQTEGDGFTLIENPSDQNAALVIRDDVILVSNQPDAIAKGGLPDGSLGSSAAFTDAMGKLPADEYNQAIYFDLGTVLQQAIQSDSQAQAAVSAIMPLLNALGPVAVGGTIIDNVNLALDWATTIDTSAYTDMGLPTPADMTPLDPAFAAHVPAGAPLAIFGTNLNLAYEGMMAGLNLQAGSMGKQGTQMQDSIAQVEAAFTQFTGLDLKDDVFSWMTGNYALFLMLNPDLNTQSSFGVFQTFPVDFGLAIESTDPTKAAALVDGLTKGIQQAVQMMPSSQDNKTEVTVTNETIVGTSTTVITITAPNAPWPVELLVGANGDVFALGTRNAVQAIFARDGGLPSNAAYQNAQNYVLANNSSLLYLGTEGLLPLADLITAMNQDNKQAEQMAQTVRDVLNLISSATVSQSVDADGTTRGRAMLSLSE